MKDKILLFIAQGFGTGQLPKMPGTWGSLVGIPFYWLMHDLSLMSYLAITILFFIFGCWLCGQASKQLGQHDHPSIVWDEIVGFLFTMVAVPYGWGWIIAGFLLFRLFDIWKPWPIAWADKQIKGGTGVMVDDVIAAIYACIVLHILVFLV